MYNLKKKITNPCYSMLIKGIIIFYLFKIILNTNVEIN